MSIISDLDTVVSVSHHLGAHSAVKSYSLRESDGSEGVHSVGYPPCEASDYRIGKSHSLLKF